MAPPTWATPVQTKFLQGWMADFLSRQAEGKLHLFWPPVQEAWFKKWPEHANVQLPLPSDASARALTKEELDLVGAAITKRKGVSCQSCVSIPR